MDKPIYLEIDGHRYELEEIRTPRFFFVSIKPLPLSHIMGHKLGGGLVERLYMSVQVNGKYYGVKPDMKAVLPARYHESQPPEPTEISYDQGQTDYRHYRS